jgi:rhodanese-related sulfurtransferase
MSSERSSTIGRERATNEKLDFRDMQDFVMVSASVSSPRPPTTERVVGLNRGPWVALPAEPREVGSAEGTILDVRPFADYAAGHAPGAISVPVSGSSFATKAAFVLLPDEPFVVHARTRDEALEAARKLWAVGLLDVGGYVLQTSTPEQLATVDACELKRLIDEGAVQVVDVREASERDDGYIPGSRNIPYRLLRKLAGDGLERDKPVVTVCESGPRAAIAASILVCEGFDARPVVGGGVPDFTGEIVGFRRCGS